MSARRSTSTLAASSRGNVRVSSTSSTSAHCSTPTWRSMIRPFCITILYHNLLLFIDIFHI
jgi:hypothetical protein